MNLYIYDYNNYYNRIYKKAGDSIADYVDYLYYGPVVGVYGFTPGDGVNTTQVIGTNVQPYYDGKGNYLIAHNPETNEIDSRWFIIDHNRTRNGQWVLTLRRDLIADYYYDIIEAPMFIEKATLSADNPLLFNKEEMTYNQILKSSTQIKDKSGCSWIVGYYAKNATNIQGTVKTNIKEDVPAINIDTPIRNWIYYDNQTNPFAGVPSAINYVFRVANQSAAAKMGYKFNINSNSGITTPTQDNSLSNESLKCMANTAMVAWGIDDYITTNNLLPSMNSYVGAYAQVSTQAQLNEFLSYNGKLVRDTNGEIYLVNIYQESAKTNTYDVTSGNLFNTLSNIATNAKYTKSDSSGTDWLIGQKCFSGSVSTSTFKVDVTANTYRLGLTRQQEYEVSYDLTSATKLITEDAPYNLFAIPYGAITVKDILNNKQYTTEAELGLNTAVTMQVQATSSVIYDLQLLPYCPIPELITDDGEITVTSGDQFSLITYGNDNSVEVKGVIFNIAKSAFSFNIPYTVTTGLTAIDRKVNNECDKWRLSSPNYSNYFDFSVEKNNGIQYFNVDCAYKPYTPYIHINPNFNGLYGYDDNSPRGLVLGGDFSLSQVIDQWQQYQVQNKNFQNIFDRQIQNMEIQQKYQRIGDIASAITGSFTGAGSGALAGAAYSGGNPYAAAAGAIIGGVTSTAAGIADVAINDKLRAEALDYTQDMFGYQLGNIQALPSTISKVSSFNPNNKIFPVIEYYTATDIEKNALKDKIKYNGMTVMTIGKIVDYLQIDQSYIKGKLIRLENISDDFHIINAISGELNKGVYI